MAVRTKQLFLKTYAAGSAAMDAVAYTVPPNHTTIVKEVSILNGNGAAPQSSGMYIKGANGVDLATLLPFGPIAPAAEAATRSRFVVLEPGDELHFQTTAILTAPLYVMVSGTELAGVS